MASKAGAGSKLLVRVMAAILTAGLSARAERGATVPVLPQDASDTRQAMAEAEVRWIAGKTGWKTASVPRIEVRTTRDLAIMFFGNAEGYEGVRPLALYARDQHILFLADALALDNLLDQSILLHELVHHMQVGNNVEFDCREETERQAYRLQVEWLREHGVAQPYAFVGVSQSQIDGLTCP